MSQRTRQDLSHLILWLILSIVAFVALKFLDLPISLLWRAFAAVNFGTLFLYGFDKLSAQSRLRRVSERVLYLTAFLFGSPGALVGMFLFRHKTSKVSFQFTLAIVVFVQVAIILALQKFVL